MGAPDGGYVGRACGADPSGVTHTFNDALSRFPLFACNMSCVPPAVYSILVNIFNHVC